MSYTNQEKTNPLIRISKEDLEKELSFDELGGLSKQIEILKDFEYFIKKTLDQEESVAISGKLLLIGPPGTGKTACARAFAQSINWPYFELDISSIVSSYLGETPKSIAAVFENITSIAKKNIKEKSTGALLFLDEFDSIASNRVNSRDHQEIARAVNALLIELERRSFNKTGVFIICATNLESQLDPALRRRFDTVVYFEMPDKNGRVDILRKLALKVNLEKLDYDVLANKTQEFSPADLRRLIYRAIFLKIIKPNLVVDTNQLISLIDDGKILPSNINSSGLEQHNKSLSDKDFFLDDISNSFDQSNSYIEVLLHAVERDEERKNDIILALKEIEKIPYEIRLDLYYYSQGKILRERNPAKMIEDYYLKRFG